MNKRVYIILLMILIVIILFLLMLYFFLIKPHIYDYFHGKEAIDSFIETTFENKTSHEEIASTLLNWMNENLFYPREEHKVFGAFYRVRNKTMFFYRSTPASWILKTKAGRCGEFAHFFVEIMTRMGYKASYVKADGWDHAWAEYYTPNRFKIIVDTSGNNITLDPIKWVEGHNITKVYATDIKGKKEDVTKDYLPPDSLTNKAD